MYENIGWPTVVQQEKTKECPIKSRFKACYAVKAQPCDAARTNVMAYFM
jgi:hypothetical protein